MGLPGALFGWLGAEKAEDQQYAASQRSEALTRETRDMQMDFLKQGRDTARGDIKGGVGRQVDTLSQIPQRVNPIYESGYSNLNNLARESASSQSGIYGRAMGQSRDQLSQGYGGGRSAMDAGYGGAESRLQGYGTDARNIIQGSRDASGNIIQGGQGAAGQELTGGYGTAADIYGGALERGTAAFDPYSAGGSAAIQGMQNQIGGGVYDSPEFQGRVDFAQNAARERLSAMGMGDSGEDLLTETGIANDMYLQEQQRQDAIRGQLAQYGYGAAGSTAGLEASMGSAQANAALSTGQSLAGLYERGAGQELSAEQLAASQRLGATQDVATRLAAQDVNQGLSQADLSTREGSAMANLYQQNALQQGGIQSGLYNQLIQQGASKTADQAALEQNYLNNLSNIYGQEGASLATIATGTGSAQSSVAGTAGSNLAQIAMAQGNNAAASKMAQWGAIQQGINEEEANALEFFGGQFG